MEGSGKCCCRSCVRSPSLVCGEYESAIESILPFAMRSGSLPSARLVHRGPGLVMIARHSVASPLRALPELLNVPDWAATSSHLFVLASEPVALPCSLMKCGDAVYRR